MMSDVLVGSDLSVTFKPSVKAISVTMPVVDYINNAEGVISHNARVSNPSNQTNFDSAGKLLNYCAMNGHWSVFEQANLTLEVKCPRDIARQILRHRSFQFQEYSGRYAEMQEFGLRECRLQDTKNRQNSLENDDLHLESTWEAVQQEVIDFVNSRYQWALDNGIAKEVARAILPEGLTISTMYINGTVRSWMHYIDVRCDKATQKEHREVAELCKVELLKHFPILTDYFNKDKTT